MSLIKKEPKPKGLGYKLDKYFWWLFSMLPIMLCLVVYFFVLARVHSVEEVNASNEVLTNIFYKYGLISDNLNTFALGIFRVDPETHFIYRTFASAFGGGPADIVPIFNLFGTENAFIVFLTWFVEVEIIHLLVDVVLLIPRFAHKFLGGISND